MSRCKITVFIRSKNFCIPITFNNPLKACFSIEQEISFYNPIMPGTNCKSIFLIKKSVFNGFLKIIGAQNLSLFLFNA